MRMDVQGRAAALKIVDVWRAGNETGLVTPKVLYDPSVRAPDGERKAPIAKESIGLVMHGTAGTNSLRTLTVDSPSDGRWACAHYLVPKGDVNKALKLVPDGFMCNHAGVAEFGGFSDFNSHYFGIENENRQDWHEQVDVFQLMTDALLWCNMAQLHGLLDYRVVSHSTIAVPHGRRQDPEAGLYRWSLFWDFVWQIRRDWPRVWPPGPWLGGCPAD